MSAYKVATSSELMENYRQADILDPQKKFIALQTSTSASLLFSIDGVGGFYLTREVTGDPKNKHGWIRDNLGAAQIGSGATCKTFAAAQAVQGKPAADGNPASSIHLAMVVDDGTNDHLYLSLHNSDVDLSWTKSPAWVACPFNALDFAGDPITPPAPFHIVGAWIGEATDKEYIVVDIARDPSSPEPEVSRFYIDGTGSGNPVWKPHDLAVDMSAKNYSICLGRRTPTGREEKRHPVDGLYTSGAVAGFPVLLYKPLYDIFDPTAPPNSSRLKLTAAGNLIADAIAACRKPDNTSDLYAVAQGKLYWFGSDNQKDGATAERVVSSPLLNGVRALYAHAEGGAVTVWGLNGSDQVFYLSCLLGQQKQSSAWTVPLPIMTGVDAISPYIDRDYSAKTFFAHSAAGFVKLVKSPTTSLWNQRHITLPPSKKTNPATPIKSYTTHIQLTDANDLAPKKPVPVKLTASNVISVYINHLYYVLGPTAVEVETDPFGTITIVEATTSLGGTRFGVTVASQETVIVNTMDTAWQRNAKYTTVDSLKNAKIVNRDGSTRNFVPAGTSADNLKQVAHSNTCLAQAYDGTKNNGLPTSARPLVTQRSGAMASTSGVSGILVDLGDLLRWLESAVDAVVEFIKDVLTEAWHLVVTIGEAVYHAILDCVEAVVAALTWVYNAIKILVEDVIKFLEFLFGWQDILITHRVLKNLMLCLSRHAIDSIQTSKVRLNALFQQAQHEINNWANIPDFNQTVGGTFAANPPPAAQRSAPANLGIHHFQGNCADSSSKLSPVSPAAAILDDLVKLMNAEGDTLKNAAQAIKTDIIDKFADLSVAEVIKKLGAIIIDTILQSAENVLEALLDVCAQLMGGMIDILTSKLDIPVLSWLYKDLTGDDLSFLDLICLIAAIPATLVYKITTEIFEHTAKAPFPANDPFTKGLLAAKSFADIQKLFVVSQASVQTASRGSAAMLPAAALGARDTPPLLDQDLLKKLGFVTGICSLIGAAALIIVTNIQRFSVEDTEAGVTLAAVSSFANVLYLSPDIPALFNWNSSTWYADLNGVLTVASIVKGLAAIPLAGIKNEEERFNETKSFVFGFIETLMNIIWNIPVGFNIYDNANAAYTSYQSLIPESVGNFAFNLAGAIEVDIVALVNSSKNPDSDIALLAAIALQGGLMVTYGASMVAAGAIYMFRPDQHH
jgi:hypothetical protein